MLPLMPSIVSAATSALTTASSVASTVALKRGSRPDFDSEVEESVLVAGSYSDLVVEKARKRSPDPLFPIVPVRPIPKGARLATKLRCDDYKGASVPTRTMIDPSCFSIGSRSVISLPTGTPAIIRSRRTP